eukprot:TRINITY_DN14600_c0_g1_i1.p1 TRINITY_DN14600_c0_g1~~TRINITY_DN14600_c0_g1_i1.p1  ORF type:complete len:268 (+),score=46.49 TRINITY_DN14600_c0_g1_i1:93-896(+)
MLGGESSHDPDSGYSTALSYDSAPNSLLYLFQPVHLVIGICVIPLLTIAASYAVYFHDSPTSIHTWLPFISDTGQFAPESGIFSLGLSFTALLFIALVILQHKSVSVRIRDLYMLKGESKRPIRINTVAGWFGLIAGLGLFGVAAFQESTQLIQHLISAAIFFGGGIVYICLQTVVSYTIHGAGCLFFVRVALCLTAIASVVLLGCFFMFLVPTDQRMFLGFCGLFECTLTASLLIHIATFIRDTQGVKIRLAVTMTAAEAPLLLRR